MNTNNFYIRIIFIINYEGFVFERRGHFYKLYPSIIDEEEINHKIYGEVL